MSVTTDTSSTRTVASPPCDDIGASWQRSLRAGLRPEHFDPPYAGEADRDDALLLAAAPVLDELEADLADAPVAVVLGDATGLIVDRRVRDAALRKRLDGVLLASGFGYSEQAVGTNAIGTALVQRRPVVVNGHELFAVALSDTACAGAPIADPKTGRIRGVLGLGCSVTDASELMLPVAVRAARQIEDRLLEGTLLGLSPPAGNGSGPRTRQVTTTRPGWHSLTDTERQVAELVAEGLTNREAAEKLFFSHHTVGFHLRSVFRKLDVRSRVELARVMVEHRVMSTTGAPQ
jgi:DNA-binding CsgD family transcriptional regulator